MKLPNWTSRGYLMNQGILYRYSPEVETEEAQLVVPFKKERLQQYHDVPTAGHYGAEGLTTKLPLEHIFLVCENTMLTSNQMKS
ncbi:hypothetical protein AVEN_79267-1 [Araneus ventricosus]|uniref:Uncharacterized protein n=1 Tax=Araneus ventricosus TaxID=182803 RepID=A0A4Y2TQR5_ARAVE|nr:hypothetical protein AVEN_79267-1 [Araneus ventricosus]